MGILLACILGSCAILAATLWAMGGIQRPGQRNLQVIEHASSVRPSYAPGHPLRVLTWNIAFAYGRGSEGWGYDPRARREILERLRQIAEVIRQARADLVFLQEVDFESARSHRIHQARVLRELLDFPFLAEAESWRANYVPYPYWPMRRHFGRMRSGSAVLSRFPIKKHTLETLPKARGTSVLHRGFSPFRYFQKVELEFSKKTLVWANVHLEAFDAEARTQQAAILAGRITQERWDGIAGDFNALPASETERGPFLDPYSEDYRNDQTSKLMDLWTTEGWKDVSGDAVAAESWRTFPTPRSDRRLDYIFVREDRAKVREARVITEAGGVSDHFPIVAELDWT